MTPASRSAPEKEEAKTKPDAAVYVYLRPHRQPAGAPRQCGCDSGASCCSNILSHGAVRRQVSTRGYAHVPKCPALRFAALLSPIPPQVEKAVKNLGQEVNNP